jgi:hypothetical protein
MSARSVVGLLGGGSVLVVVACATSCGYPDFTFADVPKKKTSSSSSSSSGSSSSSSGAGGRPSSSSSSSSSGAGGSGGAGGASSSSSSSSSSSGQVFDLPCKDGALSCVGPAEVCCYNTGDGTCDACSVNGKCPPSCGGNGFNQLVCNNKEDCPPGNECCGSFILGSPDFIKYTQCSPTCGAGEQKLCTATSQCGNLEACVSSGYSGYKYCF